MEQGMQLLNNFKPVEGFRMSWHSDKARREWEPRINRISSEWGEVERQSVVAGIRRAVRQPVRVGLQFEQLRAWAMRYGLHIKPIKAVGYFENFAHRYIEGNDMYVTVVARSASDLNTDDEKELDALLDYPECCQSFFYDHFPRILDPVYQAAERSESLITDSYRDSKTEVITLTNPSAHSNSILRFCGLRTIPHIACRFDCEKSIELGKRMLSLYSRQSQQALLELFAHPMSYDLYHGVVILKTPFFRYVNHSNAARKRYVVEVKGKG